MTDAPEPAPSATILDRMLAAGMSDDRAREHLARGVVHVQSDVVTDPASPAPWPTRWVVAAQ